MLNNLYKHEFKALLMWFVPLWLGVFVICMLCKLTYVSADLMDVGTSSDIVYSVSVIIRSGSSALCFLALSALLYLTLGIIVVRFYKNIFSGEGYFTMCIPVTAGQHHVCKMVCACICALVSVIVGTISLEIFSINLVGQQYSFLDLFFGIFFDADFFKIAVLIELIIGVFVFIIYKVAYLYVSVVFGQKFKNKIGGAIISYLLIQLIVSVFVGILCMGASVIIAATSHYIQYSKILVHVFLIGYILVYSGITTAFIAITQNHLKNRFNLE